MGMADRLNPWVVIEADNLRYTHAKAVGMVMIIKAVQR
jgi:hypothetical protein